MDWHDILRYGSAIFALLAVIYVFFSLYKLFILDYNKEQRELKIKNKYKKKYKKKYEKLLRELNENKKNNENIDNIENDPNSQS